VPKGDRALDAIDRLALACSKDLRVALPKKVGEGRSWALSMRGCVARKRYPDIEWPPVVGDHETIHKAWTVITDELEDLGEQLAEEAEGAPPQPGPGPQPKPEPQPEPKPAPEPPKPKFDPLPPSRTLAFEDKQKFLVPYTSPWDNSARTIDVAKAGLADPSSKVRRIYLPGLDRFSKIVTDELGLQTQWATHALAVTTTYLAAQGVGKAEIEKGFEWRVFWFVPPVLTDVVYWPTYEESVSSGTGGRFFMPGTYDSADDALAAAEAFLAKYEPHPDWK